MTMKENYSVKCENILNNLDGKKKLLLHSCCGPCSSYVISYLTNYFDITILYYNKYVYVRRNPTEGRCFY